PLPHPHRHIPLFPSSTLLFFFQRYRDHRDLHSFPTRRSSDLRSERMSTPTPANCSGLANSGVPAKAPGVEIPLPEAFQRLELLRSEEHTSELQSLTNLVCRLLLEKKKKKYRHIYRTHKIVT